MTIRKYQTKDKEQVREMITQVLRGIFGSFGIKEWEDFKEYDAMYVLEDNGKIVGSAALKDMEDSTGKLKRMYLYKEYRGKGLGAKLLKKIEEFALNKGLTRIILSTSYPQLKTAFEFYKKHGFTEMKNPDMEREFPDLKKETVNLSEIRFMEKKYEQI